MQGWLTRKTAADQESSTATVRPGCGHVLVVGGAGYIGSMLCRRLLEHGRKVRVLDRMLYSDASIRDLCVFPNFEMIAADWRDSSAAASAFSGVRDVVHLAAVPGGARDGASLLRESHAPMRAFAIAARAKGVERFVLASSCAVYGAPASAVTEATRLRPSSLFARLASAAETSALEAANDAFHPTVLRLAHVFGLSWRPRWDLLVHLFAAKAHISRQIHVSNGAQWRPFVHVRDVADGIVRVLRADPNVAAGEIFNLGDRRLTHTLSGVADRVRVQFPGTSIERSTTGDAHHRRVSFDKILARLGFESALPLEYGIHELRVALESGAQVYRDGQEYFDTEGICESEEWLDSQTASAYTA